MATASSNRNRGRPQGRPGLVACITVVAACVSPRIQIVDRRTALENQILGTWHELDGQMQLIASVREEGAAAKLSRLQAEALDARRQVIFFQDEVDELKSAGCLGEGNDGLLVLRQCERSVPDGVTRPAVLSERINRARAVLFDYIVQTSPVLSRRDMPQLRRAFARMKRNSARSGDWLQAEDGEWYKKQ